MTSADPKKREFAFSDRNFNVIKDIAYRSSGIKLSDHKRDMVYGRLARRLRQLKIENFDDYCALITDSNNSEFGEFINSLTTNLTSFFREKHHFEFLKSSVCPWLRAKARNDKRIRIWSAGCSTGEEPYSIAMTLASTLDLRDMDLKILATDLDSNVVAKAKTGIYDTERIESLPQETQQKYFKVNTDGKRVMVREKYRELITFKVLNLLFDWPMKGPFEVIFCRNVVIYFDKDTQRVLFDRFAKLLVDGGYLFIGHSENLHGVTDRFKSLGKTVYQKVK